MPPRKRRYVAISCTLEDVEGKLESYGGEYDLLAQSAYQVGIGFGSYVNVLLTFRIREAIKQEQTIMIDEKMVAGVKKLA